MEAAQEWIGLLGVAVAFGLPTLTAWWFVGVFGE
jgi:hypothetical protein